ncbi:MAG: DNA-binding protein, partial [Hyphomicrobiales bacterium]|nr:DNA-binding protein [Hyphomicrobiales bacterium]
MSEKNLVPNKNDFIFYTTSDGAVKIGIIIQDETVWLTQKQMAELFGVQVPAINKHLRNIFASG